MRRSIPPLPVTLHAIGETFAPCGELLDDFAAGNVARSSVFGQGEPPPGKTWCEGCLEAVAKERRQRAAQGRA